MYQIKYENVINDFDNQIKDLLKYLKLDYENSVKNFNNTAKKREKIHTPSYDQVTKPLYSNSINRHLNYEDINEVKIDVERWINFYSYT